MTSIKLISSVLCLLFLTSISPKTIGGSSVSVVGSYAICNKASDLEADDLVMLTLNPDYSFDYINHFVPYEKIHCSGKWAFENDVIVLSGYEADYPICDVWKVTKNEKCIKSHKGLTTYRLCNIELCQ